MTYDSPFWAFEGGVILRLLIFKRKVWWPQKDEKEKKEFWKYDCSFGELNPSQLHEMQECWPLHHPDIVIGESRLAKSVLWNKSSKFTNPSLIQIVTINIVHKGLPIIIEP